MSNPRFAEYATSGAFTLTLSRNQVAALSMIAAGQGAGYGISGSVLERKGLAEMVASPDAHDPDRQEFRATLAGLRAADLLSEAGLTNGQTDAVAAELHALRAEVETRRFESVEARRDARSAMARLQAAQADLEVATREVASLTRQLETGLRLRDRRPFEAEPRVTLRDPMPARSDAELLAAVQEPA